MSACGHGDLSGGLSKDSEKEISSATCDNSGIAGMKPSFSGHTLTEAVPIEAGSTAEPLAPVDIVSAHVISTIECVYGGTDPGKSGIVPNIATTTAKPKEDLDNETASMMDVEIDHDQDSANSMNTVPENVKDIILDVKHNLINSKEIAEIMQGDSEKDSSSSHSEEIVLRWEDDDDDENDETTPTDDVLKLLDRELGLIEDFSEIPQDKIDNPNKTDELESVSEKTLGENKIADTTKKLESNQNSVVIQDVKNSNQNVKPDDVIASANNADASQLNDQSTVKSNENAKEQASEIDDVVMTRGSFDESQKIIDDVDNLFKRVTEMQKANDLITEIVQDSNITDQVDSDTKEKPDQDFVMKKEDPIVDTVEPKCLKSSKDKNTEIMSESSLKAVVEEMDLDISTGTINKQPIVGNPSVPTESTNFIEKENNATTLNKSVSQNEEKVCEEIAILEDSKINNTDIEDIKMEVSKVDEPDNSQNNLTASCVPSVNKCILPIEDSNISHNVKAENEDGQISDIPSDTLINQQLEAAKKDTQGTDDKNQSDDMEKFDEEQIIEDADVIASQLLEDSVIDTTITPNINHRINKPNVMLDIPTQEMSAIEAELDDDLDSELFSEGNDSGELKFDTSLQASSKSDVTIGLTDDSEIKETEDTKIGIKTHDTITSTLTKDITSPSIEIDGTTSKLNITIISPTKTGYVSSPSKSTENVHHTSKTIEFADANQSMLNIVKEEPSASKSDDATKLIQAVVEETSKEMQVDDEKPSTSKSIPDNNVNPSTSNVKPEVGDEKPSTSKSIPDNDVNASTSNVNEDIDDEKPSTSKSIPDDYVNPSTTNVNQEIDHEKPSTSKSIPDDDVNPSTSNVKQEVGNEKPSTSKSIQDNDVNPSTSNAKEEVGDVKPSTSTSEKLTPDNADEIHEITDSLGLLAESFRVIDDDDDDDAEDPEDDDEDFDPYEETSSQMLEDLEDSNTPPPFVDPKGMDKPELSPKTQEERESDEGTMDIVDDIECVENELPEMDLPDDAASETPSTEDKADKEDEPEIIDADAQKDKPTDKLHYPPEKIFNILEKVLGQHGLTDMSKQPVPPAGKVLNYVEVEGSSDSDDVVEVSKSDISADADVISVNIPKEVEVMSTSSSRSTSEIVSKEGEVVINGVPKPPPNKVSKINTSEVSIKTKGSSSLALHIPETTSVIEPKAAKEVIFSLDSDEEDTGEKKSPVKSEENVPEKETSPKPTDKKCINPQCTNETTVYYQADRATAAYYSLTRRSAAVCEQCSLRASERSEALINGIKDFRPLLELEMEAPSQQLVEISDSDSDEETGDDTDVIGEKGAQYLKEHLADMINETWAKYKLESRLKDTEAFLMSELEKMEAGAKEIDAMLDECQKKTDAIRLDFYKDYEPRRKSLGAIVIHDTPFSSYSCDEKLENVKDYSHTEKDLEEAVPEATGSRYPKRRATSIASDTPAKKPAIPMGYTPLGGIKEEARSSFHLDQSKTDDDKEDISVVKLSAESAPAELPPSGEIIRPPLKNGMATYAMRNAFGTWLKGKIMDVQPKTAGQTFTMCRVKFEHKVKNPCKVLPARCLAYPEPCEVRMTIGTRVIALFKDPHNTARRESFYSGVVAEIPNPVNNYRYLVFFDDGYAQYVHHQHTRIVCESSSLVWEEVHPFIRDFICNYLLSYPERPMVRLHAGEKLKTEWNGKWWDSKVLQVDASIALIHFDEDNRTEWIYRGSTRLAPLYLELQAAEKAGEGRTRSRLPRSKAQMRSNMPCVEYTRSDEQAAAKTTAETQAQQQHSEELRRQRAVAKKSTTPISQAPTVVQGTPLEGVISRVVYYTPKNAVKPYKMSAHTCTAKCRRSDLLSLKDLRTYNPLAKPLLSGWERQTVRYKGHKEVMYRSPCGRRLRNMPELHKYLRIIQSDLAVDLFDFTPGTHCLAEFVLNKCIVGKKDLSHGKENVPVPCVNYYDESLPEFCSYNTERTPTAGVPLNIDPEFLCGCDCTDDCVDKSKCACWKMTLAGARTVGLEGSNVGYVYRRLPEPLPSGIYECNSRCKCKQTCLNRVAQHPLQLKLQVFKTINRGWGIRALNDVPKGSFLCVYAGNLLTDATANLDGLNEGDEYLAELDYIEVVESMKEGYEDDIPDIDKRLDKKGSGRSSDSNSEPTSESEDEREQSEKDGDFQPGYIHYSNVEFKKSLRKRQKLKKKEEKEKQKAVVKKDDCITISDDEEVREPSRFTAQAGMVDKGLISKHSSRVSVRTLFGKDEACYIMDAKVQGNIGRYLNHSCHPNVFVQNVFVDTHDPRFPWVAFFALSHVRAGTELTWNYNYDIGSVSGKVLYCYCGASNCRGRLL